VRGRSADRALHPASPRPSAMEILDEWFAKGEIGHEEYDDRRAVLQR
jgi:uncharacterized membrane protein